MHTEGPRQGSELALVASYVDSRRAMGKGHPVAWIGHGSGQDYPADPASARMSGYPGGRGHEGTKLFMEAGEQAAAKWREHYPEARSIAVGCPRLDGLHRLPRRARARQLAGATVAISFHAELPLCPETRSAWRHFAPGLPTVVREMQEAGAHVIGHGHPRIFDGLEPEWRRMGAEPVRDLDEVLTRTDVYAIDNSSSGPEAASLGIPVVWMSPPWYRREVHHGLRFWTWTERQAHATDPGRLAETIGAALADLPEWREGRAAMVADCYAATDGRAAERAAAAILEIVG